MADAKRKGSPLAAKVAELRTMGKTLAEKTAEMNTLLVQAEKLAQSLAGGIRIEVEVTEEEDFAENGHRTYLEFRRGQREWRFHIEVRDGDEIIQVYTLDDAPRWAKLRAASHLTELFEALTNAIQSQLNEVTAAVDNAAFLRGAFDLTREEANLTHADDFPADDFGGDEDIPF